MNIIFKPTSGPVETSNQHSGQKSGFTIIEILVASVMLVLMTMGLSSLMLSISKSSNQAQVASQKAMLIQNIRSLAIEDLGQMEVLSGGSLDKLVVLANNNELPYAWSPRFWGPREECESCVLQVGYAVENSTDVPGLYHLRILFRNTQTNQNEVRNIYVGFNR
jgi:type II secretory pathway pseudopilin PulG